MSLKIGIIGDFDGRLSHLATNASLEHSGKSLARSVQFEWVPTESLEASTEVLAKYNGLWCSPGSPYRSMQGALNGIQFARTKKIPFLGTCGGFQHAVLEFAQNELGFSSAELETLIVPLECSLFEKESAIHLRAGSRARGIYGTEQIWEKFRCNYGLGARGREILKDGKLQITGSDASDQALMAELSEHPFFVATLFQPQLSSSPERPHPLITAYLQASIVAHLS